MSETQSGAIIFDFDGTIADSFDIFVETLEEVTRRPQPLTAEEIADLRGSSTLDIIKKLEVKKWQMPRLVINGRKGIARKMDRVNVFEGIPEAITELKEKNESLYLLSTNSEDAISGFLGRHGLENTMTDMYAGTGVFGKAKRLSALLKKEGLIAAHCIYIGDETRDIEAAKEVGLKSVAVGWGYSTPEALVSYKPDALVARPEDLVAAIDALQ